MLLLPSYGNLAASLEDGLVGALVVFAFSLAYLPFRVSFTSLLPFAHLISGVEYFFHQYLLKCKNVVP